MSTSTTINWPNTKDIPTEGARPVWAKGLGTGLLSGWYRWAVARRVSHLGNRLRLVGRPVVINHGQLIIGNDVQLISDYQPTRLAVGAQAQLKIGDGTVINSSILAAQRQITIGKDCRLAPFVHFMDSDFHDVGDRLADGKSGPIIIGDRVMIGAHTLILRGVTVGDGAELLPGSVVTKDIPAGALAGGVPAKVLQRRMAG